MMMRRMKAIDITCTQGDVSFLRNLSLFNQAWYASHSCKVSLFIEYVKYLIAFSSFLPFFGLAKYSDLS